jgi:hypothetical protein
MVGTPENGQLAERFWGVVVGLTGDLFAEAMRLALRMPWLLDPESPDDVLPLIGAERRIRQYPGESAAAYRARLHAAWDTYSAPGKTAIETELALAGWPGTVVFYDRPGPKGEPAPYWSQFWVRFGVGDHPVTGDAPAWDSGATWDGSTLWDIGAPAAFIATIRAIVSKWKPSRWICRGFEFELGQQNWDGSGVWDDGVTTWDGYFALEF